MGWQILRTRLWITLNKNPSTVEVFKEEDLFLYRNLRIGSSRNQKFAVKMLGPHQVTQRCIGDFYLCKDLTQDTKFYCHARDMEFFECSYMKEARNIASADHDEFEISQVLGHVGTPNTDNFRFIVTFTVDPDTKHHLRFRDVQFVDHVKTYIRKTLALKCLVSKIDKEVSTTSRVRQQSRLLKDPNFTV